MHQYPTLTNGIHSGDGMVIAWQNGPVSEGVNGALPDLVVRALLERIEEFQKTVPCKENTAIIGHLREILALLDARTRDRYRRGVMGSSEV